MTYVTEQTSEELRAHMRRLQAMPGWHNPLDDRLWKEVQTLEAERDQLRAEVERLRPNALRYEWLTEDHPKQETRVWVHQIAMTFNTRGRGHIDAAIDRAIEAAKEAK